MRVTMQDEAAFEAFVRASGPSLLRTAVLLTGDRGHAEDLLQVALERTARHWGKLHTSPEGYARRALVNGARDRHRRRRIRAPEVAAEWTVERGVPDTTARIDLLDALAEALRALPPRQRSVLVCRYVMDLDEQQTADLLGVRIGTVKASASRGLTNLRGLAPAFELSHTDRSDT